MRTEVSGSYGGGAFIGGMVCPGPLPDAAKGGLDVFSGGMKHPFDIVTERGACKVSEGVIYCGSRKEVQVKELSVGNTFSGTVYLVVTWDSSGEFTGELTTTKPQSDDDKAYRKLYDFEDGKPTMDYRAAPVFVLYN